MLLNMLIIYDITSVDINCISSECSSFHPFVHFNHLDKKLM